jgi:high affinity Mn2+ porin
LFGGVQGGYQAIPAIALDAHPRPTCRSLISWSSQVPSYRATGTGTATTLEYVGTLRGRLGYSDGKLDALRHRRLRWASTASSRTDLITGNEDATPGQLRIGYALGGGADYALGGRWSARAGGSPIRTSAWSAFPSPRRRATTRNTTCIASASG